MYLWVWRRCLYVDFSQQFWGRRNISSAVSISREPTRDHRGAYFWKGLGFTAPPQPPRRAECEQKTNYELRIVSLLTYAEEEFKDEKFLGWKQITNYKLQITSCWRTRSTISNMNHERKLTGWPHGLRFPITNDATPSPNVILPATRGALTSSPRCPLFLFFPMSITSMWNGLSGAAKSKRHSFIAVDLVKIMAIALVPVSPPRRHLNISLLKAFIFLD